jgi:hypothetical protein
VELGFAEKASHLAYRHVKDGVALEMFPYGGERQRLAVANGIIACMSCCKCLAVSVDARLLLNLNTLANHIKCCMAGFFGILIVDESLSRTAKNRLCEKLCDVSEIVGLSLLVLAALAQYCIPELCRKQTAADFIFWCLSKGQKVHRDTIRMGSRRI